MTPKPTNHVRELAAREAYLRRIARRPARRGGSTRIEAFAVVMLGLAIIAFPWGRLGPSREAEAQPLSYVRLQSGDQETGVVDERSAYPQAFRGCNEARAAGAAPVYAGDAGHGPWLDGDSDGIGCEPHRNKR